MTWDRLTKPIAALYRARAYFAIGLLLLAINTVYAPPFQAITNGRIWYHDLVDKGIGSLDKAAYVILLAGLAYTVLADVAEFLWTNKIQDDIRAGFKDIGNTIATGVSGITHESIVSWLQRGVSSKEEYREVGVVALLQHYGDHSQHVDSHFRYVLENILDQYAAPAAITRENFNQSVIVRKIDGQNLLQWEDEKRYTLICPSGAGKNVLRAYMSCRAHPTDVNELTKRVDLKAYVGGALVFSFMEWMTTQNSPQLKDGTVIRSGDGTLTYDGHWLILDFRKELTISKEETQVRILENSFISPDDRCYNVILDQPTFNLRFSMRLENLPGWSLMKPIVGATWYHSQAAEFATIDRDNARWVSVTVPKWVLPGITLGVEWAAP